MFERALNTQWCMFCGWVYCMDTLALGGPLHHRTNVTAASSELHGLVTSEEQMY